MKKIIKNIDKPLFIISFILFIFGLIMIFSASNITAFMKYYASPYRYFYKQLKEQKIKKLLLIATGALTNSTSSQQGESIPGIAHAISIEI